MTEEELFEAARHIRDAFERVAYLNRACAADPPMRQRVEALLRSDAEARGFLEEPVIPEGDGAGQCYRQHSMKVTGGCCIKSAQYASPYAAAPSSINRGSCQRT